MEAGAGATGYDCAEQQPHEPEHRAKNATKLRQSWVTAEPQDI